MCPAPSFRIYWCLLFAVIFAVPQGFAATKAAAKPKATKITLPDAYSGVAYSTTIVGLVGLASGPLTCGDAKPAFPAGLSLSYSPSGLLLSGTATTATDVLRTYVIQITDVKKNSIELDLTLTLRPPKETIIAGTEPKPTPPNPPDAPPDYSKVKFQATSVMLEQGTTATGMILGLPAKPPTLNVRAWIKSAGQPEALAQLKPPASSTSTAPVTQVPLGSDGTYSLTFVNPLVAGQDVRLALVTADGTELPADYKVSLPSTIAINPLRLKINSEIVAGAQTISGQVSMPNPAIAPNTTATPPIYGNYPQIVVWIKDPALDQWFQATLQTGTGTTGLFAPVSSDGSFNITLKNALVTGQEVEVRVVPPAGRTFLTADNPTPLTFGPTWRVKVPTAAVLIQPSIAMPLMEGVLTITGTATAPGTAGTFSVAVLKLKPQIQGSPQRDTSVCVTVDELGQYTRGRHSLPLRDIGEILPLTSSGSNTLLGTIDSTGAYKLTLANALLQDEEIQVVQVLPAGSVLTPPQRIKCASEPQKVRYMFDWDRTNLTFVAGVLISNSSASSATNANFSQANAFLALNLDRAWRLPGVDFVHGYPFGQRGSPLPNAPPGTYREPRNFDENKEGWHASGWPGINTFFEGRLTSIPVSTAAATSSPSNSTSSGTGTSSTGTSATTTSSSPTLLTSQKVFLVSAGAFFPWVLTHSGGRNPTALFVAPLSRVGFDTITGAGTASNVILPGNQVGSLSYQTAYNFFAFGGRVGNMRLSASPNRAPQIEQHLDVTIGRYGNLQSFICHTMPVPQGSTPMDPPGSSCRADYPSTFPPGTPVVQSRKQLYRLDIEGLVKIPIPATAIPFYIGFNANIAQHTVGAAKLDHGFAPPDDIRILFGTKFDMGALLSKLNLAPSQ